MTNRQNLPTEFAVQEVVNYEKKFGHEGLRLACHVAFPFILTPELVNLIRINFLDNERIPWIAETDILLSSLCRPVGDGLFQVEPALRQVLLVELENQFGWFRLYELANFLQFYIIEKPNQNKSASEIYSWVARAYVEPENVIEELDQSLDGLSYADGFSDMDILAEQIRLTQIVEIISDALEQSGSKRYPQVLIKSRALAERLYLDPKEPAVKTSAAEASQAAPPIKNIHGWPAERVQELQRQVAQAFGTPVEFRDDFEKGDQQGPWMVVIPGGRFLMGSPPEERGRSSDERQHEVEISPLAVGKYPVTFEDYDLFCKATGREKADDWGWGRGSRPVINVSWGDATVYCGWLSEQTEARYRLLTEAEWEYACRAGTATRYCFEDSEERLGEYAWYSSNAEGKTHPVGEKLENVWKLCDVHGNVWEWVQDWYGDYLEELQQDPSGSESGSYRVFRGGSLVNDAVGCRSAFRYYAPPVHRHDNLGFRLARTGPWPSYPFTLEPQVQTETSVKYEPYQSIRDELKDGTEAPEMVYVPGGTFKMGDIQGKGDSDERPVHDVTLDDFAIGRYPLTVGEFRRFVEDTGYKTEAERKDGARIFDRKEEQWVDKSDASWRNPYMPQEEDHPVVCVSWNDAKAYCQWLSKQTGETYSLPTEAEWEYACRASSDTAYFFGDDESLLEKYAWYWKNSEQKTHPVGKNQANPWNLFDMRGNVWEWVQDWYGDYSREPRQNPSGPALGSGRVIRGGSWSRGAVLCRSAYRSVARPGGRDGYLGFRLTRAV